MPKFLWVVRDFTLQLVDDEDREIDPRRYLERALEDKATSGGTEAAQKNEIKQHLRKYFPERDCCTMVRPIVDENNLQSLDSIGIEDLRSEFVEQAFNLRTRVLQGMKIKHINNQEMDGLTWIDMAQQYIEAINDGTVPTIESSWTYICRSRAQTIFEKAKDSFDEMIAQEIQAPVSERDLEQCLEYHADKLK